MLFPALCFWEVEDVQGPEDLVAVNIQKSRDRVFTDGIKHPNPDPSGPSEILSSLQNWPFLLGTVAKGLARAINSEPPPADSVCKGRIAFKKVAILGSEELILRRDLSQRRED